MCTPDTDSIHCLFDDAEDIFYIKSTDANGFPTVKVFEFKEKILIFLPCIVAIVLFSYLVFLANLIISCATFCASNL